MKRFTLLLLAVALVGGLASCDTALDQGNPNEITIDDYYQNRTQALSGVYATYDALQELGLYARHQYFNLDLLSEEAIGTSSLQGALRSMDTRAYSPTNGSITPMWNALYLGVKRANLVLENVPDTPGLSEADTQRFRAEARFLRALYYFELVSLWGDVPLLRGVKSEVGGEPRAPADSVYNLIFNDLAFAQSNLPRKLDIADDQVGRAPKGAAYALAGRAHLMRENWSEARDAFQWVVNSGEYRLVDDYFDNFREETENNAESIFEVQFTANQAGAQWGSPGTADHTFRRQEYGWLDWNNVVASDRLLGEYEEGDPRMDMTFYQVCDPYNDGENVVLPGSDQFPNSSEYACGVSDDGAADAAKHPNQPSWRKYESYYKTATTSSVFSGINFRVMRYAGVLLWLAEAEIEMGNLSRAQELMNQVRSRPSVDLPDIGTVYDMNSRSGALDALYHEYASELAGEQVLIYSLLRRMDYWEDWAGDEVGDGLNRYLPIPQNEIDNNPDISSDDQNPGY